MLDDLENRIDEMQKSFEIAEQNYNECVKVIDNAKAVINENEPLAKTENERIKKQEEKLEKDASGHICREANGLPKVKEQYAGEYEQELVELLGFTVEVDLFYLPEETLDYEDAKYDPLSLSQMRCVAALCMKE